MGGDGVALAVPSAATYAGLRHDGGELNAYVPSTNPQVGRQKVNVRVLAPPGQAPD